MDRFGVLVHILAFLLSQVNPIKGTTSCGDHTFSGDQIDEWFEWNAHCYYGFHTGPKPDYNKAKDICESGSTHILFVETMAEHEWLANAFDHTFVSVWLGLEQQSGGEWNWVGNGVSKPLHVDDYRWDVAEPLNGNAATSDIEANKLWVTKITGDLELICESESDTTSTTTSTSTTTTTTTPTTSTKTTTMTITSATTITITKMTTPTTTAITTTMTTTTTTATTMTTSSTTVTMTLTTTTPMTTSISASTTASPPKMTTTTTTKTTTNMLTYQMINTMTITKDNTALILSSATTTTPTSDSTSMILSSGTTAVIATTPPTLISTTTTTATNIRNSTVTNTDRIYLTRCRCVSRWPSESQLAKQIRSLIADIKFVRNQTSHWRNKHNSAMEYRNSPIVIGTVAITIVFFAWIVIVIVDIMRCFGCHSSTQARDDNVEEKLGGVGSNTNSNTRGIDKRN